ncbi:TolC family protein [Helicobacter sp. MIT 21-1697]|uniref:TolC family protein n=1 Tax=Helicobacter sp. MIT 21-1697 TaxID=2993733 RepID=UPI00224B0A93|nr:TolC family protein [Helicobacter sp. MIT 21-1697]MCX2717318.1 TolC family protein [Helicobacter sp. MIT 21-1697]
MKRIILTLGFFSLLNAQQAPQDSVPYLVQVQDKAQNTESTQSSGRVFTLVELIEGAKKNYNLEAKDLAILQAQATSRAAWGEFLPTLDGAYQYQDTDNPSMRMKTHTGSIKGNWEVFSGFKTYNKVREKGSLYRASIEDRENTKDQLFLSVIEQYYGYFTNRAQLVSLDQKRIQLQSNIKRVERLFNSGLTTIDDVESLRAEALATEHDIENIKMEIEKNKLMLSLLANTEVQELERKNIKAPLFTLDENRHDLNMLNFQALSAKYQARQFNYLPILSISDTYIVNSDITKPGAISFKEDLTQWGGGGPTQMLPMLQRQFPLNQNQIMINATIHLDALTTYRQYEAAQLGYLKSLKELAYKKEEQKKDEKMYRKSLEIAVAKIKASEAALRSANIAFENVAKKYDAQILNFVDYLQSLTKKFEAESTYNQALNNYEMQKAYYIYYSGQDLQQHIE